MAEEKNEITVVQASSHEARAGINISLGSMARLVLLAYRAVLKRMNVGKTAAASSGRRCLAIDTTSGQREMTIGQQQVRLERHEDLVLPGRSVANLRNVLSEDRHTRRYARWLNGLTGTTDDGVGGKPAKSFTSALSCRHDIESPVEAALRGCRERNAQAVQAEGGQQMDRKRRTRVVLTASLTGGTAPGLLFHVIAASRQGAKSLGMDVEIFLLGLLGSTAEGRDPEQVACSVASSLRQLQIAHANPQSAVIHTFGGHTLTLSEGTVDRIYLFSVSNGAVVLRAEDQIELLARCAWNLLDGPEGTVSDGYFRNFSDDEHPARLSVAGMGVAGLRYDAAAAEKHVRFLGRVRICDRLRRGNLNAGRQDGQRLAQDLIAHLGISRNPGESDAGGLVAEATSDLNDQLSRTRRVVRHTRARHIVQHTHVAITMLSDRVAGAESRLTEVSAGGTAHRRRIRQRTQGILAAGVGVTLLAEVLGHALGRAEQVVEACGARIDAAAARVAPCEAGVRRREGVVMPAESASWQARFRGWMGGLFGGWPLRRAAGRWINAAAEAFRARLTVARWRAEYASLQEVVAALRDVLLETRGTDEALANTHDSALAKVLDAKTTRAGSDDGLLRLLPTSDYAVRKAESLWDPPRVEAAAAGLSGVVSEEGALPAAIEALIERVINQAGPIRNALAGYLSDLAPHHCSALLEQCMQDAQPALPINELSVRPRPRRRLRTIRTRSATLDALKRSGLVDRLEAGCDTRWIIADFDDELVITTEERQIDLQEIEEIRSADAVLSRQPVETVAHYAALYEPEEILAHPIVPAGMATNGAQRAVAIGIALEILTCDRSRRYRCNDDGDVLARGLDLLVQRLATDVQLSEWLKGEIKAKYRELGEVGVRGRITQALEHPDDLVPPKDRPQLTEALGVVSGHSPTSGPAGNSDPLRSRRTRGEAKTRRG